MVTQANIAVSETNGVPYCTNAKITTIEGDLGAPVTVTWFSAILASIILNFPSGSSSGASGSPGGTTYIILQVDMGDGNWFDAAWIVTTATSGPLLFLLGNGVAGAIAVQQTRSAGTAPASSAFLQMPLGGRFRFVGKTGTNNTIVATITYRTLAVR